MTATTAHTASGASGPFLERLNSEWHERASYAFLAIVLAHWGEHLTQAVQIFILGWPRPEARGLLGMPFPWLVSSETLHYAYAIVMLIGLWMLRGGYQGRARTWWNISLGIQFWHHIEHAVLQWQAITGHNWFGAPMPVSFVQAIFLKQRVELHLFYNAVVFVPMVIAMYYHLVPSDSERKSMRCSCALAPKHS